jgi:dTDP-glucose pyrophosphorylase
VEAAEPGLAGGGTLTDLTELCVAPEASIREAMRRIDRNQRGIVLVTDADARLRGTLTDGDIRRAILAGDSLDQPVDVLLGRKSGSAYAHSVTAPADADRPTLLRLMRDRDVRQIPLVDAEGRVTGLATLDEMVPQDVLPLQAVIMAGGLGTRLRPLTDQVPKAMLPVGGRPLLEHTIEQLRQAGIGRVHVSTHYQPDKIRDHFGDGRTFGVEIQYVAEDEPLGTAGALGLLEKADGPILVINGDILTAVDFRAMLDFHRHHHAELTMAVRQYDLRVPYGVVEADGWRVRAVREKPVLGFFVNAGIYLLEPAVTRAVPNGQRMDMTDLIARLLEEGRPVVSFPVVEYWLDIGQHADYEQAQRDVREGRLVR